MKKIALVAALAAISASAFAQSSVTLYGRFNTSVESQKVGDGQRTTVVQNNSSRFGLLGTEDIGGGLKASFNVENGFNNFVQISFDAVSGSELGDGNRIDIDLCHACLKSTLGAWLRISPSR